MFLQRYKGSKYSSNGVDRFGTLLFYKGTKGKKELKNYNTNSRKNQCV